MGDTRILSKENRDDIFKELHPLVSYLILIVSVIVWCYSTFAQLSYVKEENQRIERYSDANRDRMMGVLNEVKQSVQTIERRLENSENRRDN